MYMKSAYIHKIFKYVYRVYVREPLRSDGTYKHRKVIGHLQKNIYGGRSRAVRFLEIIFQLLSDNGFVSAKGDPCLFYKKHGDETHTLVSLSLDYHVLTASNQHNIII